MENNMIDVLRSLANSTEVVVIDCETQKIIQQGKVYKLMERDYSYYTVKQFMFTNNKVIMYVQAALCEDKEYYFAVATMGEGYSSGYVKLTPAQAKVVAYACDERNWVLYESEDYSGSFSISLDDWKTVEEIERVEETDR